ncbi:hypothetical protein LXJ15735_20660 [Lacrimispora xylanolytica]|uniref:Uncharacterized protein n=1 Tax=Lacrimispora xylanolytica TaxID=29375 RepID=A0ABY7A952_9FIRM|nr:MULTISPECIES: hypothetical protein [Clostridia]MBS5951686.1 hypothetical protein [Clostridium sp.]WAJ22071.1 hypothetical protein OW255_10795 [Lacrimispora xylanolytica]
MKKLLKVILTTVLLACIMILPASAAQEQTVNWGDTNYQIIVPGFIGGKDITISGQTTPAIVIEKPTINSENRYHFFDIVTTDTNATLITSTVSTADTVVGDYMVDLQDGRVSYIPFFTEDFNSISNEPIYFGFSYRDNNFNVIKEFPLWVVFQDKDTTTGNTN